MPEREQPISREEAERLKAELDDLVPQLEQEQRLKEREEQAILQNIEWAIRLRARIAQAREETGIAPYFEQWLDNPDKQCVWLLNKETWIFPEEPRPEATRHDCAHCADHVVLGARRTAGELTKQRVMTLFRTWTQRFEPINIGVNLLTLNAVIKRRTFYYKRQIDLGLLPRQHHIDEHKREYEIHLALHRLITEIIDDGNFRSAVFYEPPIPY